MRPFVVSIVALGFVAVTSFSAPRITTAFAQESATETAAATGVVFEPVTGELVTPLVAEGAAVHLERATFSPDAAYTIPAGNAELLLVTVESGTFSVTSSAPLVINRAGEGTATTGVQEWVAANTGLTLERGDSFVRPPRSQQELRNEGQESSVALMASSTAGCDRKLNCAASNVMPPCTSSTGSAENSTPIPSDEASATEATPSSSDLTRSMLESPTVPS